MPLAPGHGYHDLGEREPVDFGVDRGDITAAVTQHLTDLRQAPARAEHLGRGCVPQAVSAHHRQPRPLTGTTHDLGDSTRRDPERAVREPW